MTKCEFYDYCSHKDEKKDGEKLGFEKAWCSNYEIMKKSGGVCIIRKNILQISNNIRLGIEPSKHLI